MSVVTILCEKKKRTKGKKPKEPKEKEPNDDIPDNLCVVCLDDTVKVCPVKLPNAMYQLNYFSLCVCSCDIHETCMKTWVGISLKCPICRIPLQKYESGIYWIKQYFFTRKSRVDGGRIKISFPLYLSAHLIGFCMFMYVILKIA
jgi:hypothetical protein